MVNRLSLSGGNFQNVALHAPFMVPGSGAPMTIGLVLQAAGKRFRKFTQMLNEAVCRWQEPVGITQHRNRYRPATSSQAARPATPRNWPNASSPSSCVTSVRTIDSACTDSNKRRYSTGKYVFFVKRSKVNYCVVAMVTAYGSSNHE